ncbi:hypothetical protein AOLI_G00166860 [Acnodon oligacanthus]
MQNMEIDYADFVDSKRAELIQRVSLVMPLADVLKTNAMLSNEAYGIIKAERTSQEKMRALFDALDTAGRAAKLVFYQELRRQNPHLAQDLEAQYNAAGMLR